MFSFEQSLLLVTFVSHGKETTNAVGSLSNAVQGNVKGVKEKFHIYNVVIALEFKESLLMLRHQHAQLNCNAYTVVNCELHKFGFKLARAVNSSLQLNGTF